MGPEKAWGAMKSQKVYKMKHPNLSVWKGQKGNQYLFTVTGVKKMK